MVRLTDLPDYEREHLLAKNLPPLGPPVWTTPTKPLSEMRVALLTTAGLHYRDDPAFEFADATFRPIDGREDPDGLVMSHSSVDFDMSGFAEDVNIVFPLGKPGDADFQLDVITAALDLLNRSEGPVLENYPHDAPSVAAESAPACPVSFARDTADDGSWKSRLSQEFGQLRPWYEFSRRRRGGRTLVGIAEEPPERNVEALAEHLDAGTLPTDITWLKRAIEDIKTYYLEALTAQPGDYDQRGLQARFWQETRFGAAVLAFYHQFQESDDDRLKSIARLLAPREAVGAATGPGGGTTR